jgi:nucleotide-binding universal stress UspA family protein
MAGGQIVVGIDGSTNAKAALEWAMEEARRRDASVVAVHAWQFPSVALTECGGAAMPVLTMDDVEKASEAMARATIDEVTGDAITPRISLIVRQGKAAQVLVDEAKDAELLVVGSRGLGGYRAMLLGSVSTNVVQRAACPVVVIHRPRDVERTRKK